MQPSKLLLLCVSLLSTLGFGESIAMSGSYYAGAAQTSRGTAVPTNSYLAATPTPTPQADAKGLRVEIVFDLSQVMQRLMDYLDSAQGLALIDQMVSEYQSGASGPRPEVLANRLLQELSTRLGIELTQADIQRVQAEIAAQTNVTSVDVLIYYASSDMTSAINQILWRIVCRYPGITGHPWMVNRACRGRNWFQIVPNELASVASQIASQLPSKVQEKLNPIITALGIKNAKVWLMPVSSVSVAQGTVGYMNLKFYRKKDNIQVPPYLPAVPLRLRN